MGNLFIDDDQICVSKSPFAAYQNEVKVFDGRITPISMDNIMFKVNRGHVLSQDYVILNALSELEFATSRMVTQFVNLKGLDMDQDKVHNRLKFLNKINIITRFKFQNSDSTVNQRVYCLEKAGKYLLIGHNYDCYWKPSDNTRPIETMKEILARNQFLMSMQYKVSNFVQYKINPHFRLTTTNKIFSPHLSFCIEQPDRNYGYYIVDAIRSYSSCMKQLISRLKIYHDYYEYFTPTKEVPVVPQIILVGEDDNHLLEIYKVIAREKIKLKDMDFLYTTDLRLLDNEVNKSMVKLELFSDNGVMKVRMKIINNTNIKLRENNTF